MRIVKIRYINIVRDGAEERINKLIKKGWQPYYAPVQMNLRTSYFEESNGFFQTLVKYEGEDAKASN